MKILFLSAWYPFPPDNGSRIRIFNLLRKLAETSRITLLVFGDGFPDETPPELADICQEIHLIPRRHFDPGSLRSLAGFFSPVPRSITATFEPEMASTITRLRQSEDFDLVIASQWQTASYAKAFKGLPAIFEEVELGIFRDAISGRLKTRRDLLARLRWFKLKYYLRSLSKSFDALTVASAPEARLVSNFLHGDDRVHVIPNAVRVADYAAAVVAPEPGRIIFTGALTYGPNYQAMRWFLQNVFPQVRASYPTAELLITGDNRGIHMPDMEGVHLTGYVKDITALVASAWLSLAPIFSGGGTRLKILEALAIGTPIITTTKGAEGLDLVHEEHLLIADTPDEFANAVLELLNSPELQRSLADAGRKRVSEKYDWDVIFPDFDGAIRSVMDQIHKISL